MAVGLEQLLEARQGRALFARCTQCLQDPHSVPRAAEKGSDDIMQLGQPRLGSAKSQGIDKRYLSHPPVTNFQGGNKGPHGTVTRIHIFFQHTQQAVCTSLVMAAYRCGLQGYVAPCQWKAHGVTADFTFLLGPLFTPHLTPLQSTDPSRTLLEPAPTHLPTQGNFSGFSGGRG